MSNDNNNNETVHAETPEYIPPHAVSVYGSNDAMDEFPVLKAFQQYIDSEHTKARKRLLTMAIFFGTFILVVVAIFVVMLFNANTLNQQLNDRLVEFAMKERNAAATASTVPVVAQPPQDDAKILALTSQLEEMNQKIAEAQARADMAVAEADAKVKAATEAAAEAAEAAEAAKAEKAKEASAEKLEIQKLKAQLAAEKEKAAEEKARRREAELEEYRRKHYPELYAPKQPAVEPPPATEPGSTVSAQPETAIIADDLTDASASQSPDDPQNSLDEINDLLDSLDELDAKAEEKPEAPASSELSPINYFDDAKGAQTKVEETPSDKTAVVPANTTKPSKSDKTTKKKAKKTKTPSKPSYKVTVPKENSVTISDGDTSLDWGIPD